VKLFELESEITMSREQAAGLLRELADSLARHNEISFKREGLQYRLKVADYVEVEVEIEVASGEEDGENSIEIELSW
jgi:amphi-Trp domain-containing protein